MAGTLPPCRPPKTDRNSLIAMMVGRELTNLFPKEDAPIGEVVLVGAQPDAQRHRRGCQL
jgi:ABC-type sugar transport system ATPase subunit